MPYNESRVEDPCFSLQHESDRQRIACVAGRRTRHLYNVLFQSNQIVLFGEKSRLQVALPHISSSKMQSERKFNLPIAVRPGPFDEKRVCKSYFNGTLIVVKRSSQHNVYHSGNQSDIPIFDSSKVITFVANSHRQLHGDGHQHHHGCISGARDVVRASSAAGGL